MTNDDFAKLHAQAKSAAEEAHRDIPDTGPIGFAWVNLRATLPYSRWAKKNLGAYKGHIIGGLDISISSGKQSVAANEAAAEAYAKVLRAAGITAMSMSRLD